MINQHYQRRVVQVEEILKKCVKCYKNWSPTDVHRHLLCALLSFLKNTTTAAMALRFALIASLCVAAAFAANPWEPEARDANWLKHHEQLLNQTKHHASEIQVVFFG